METTGMHTFSPLLLAAADGTLRVQLKRWSETGTLSVKAGVIRKIPGQT
jgi:hypothetical protein